MWFTISTKIPKINIKEFTDLPQDLKDYLWNFRVQKEFSYKNLNYFIYHYTVITVDSTVYCNKKYKNTYNTVKDLFASNKMSQTDLMRLSDAYIVNGKIIKNRLGIDFNNDKPWRSLRYNWHNTVSPLELEH